MTTLLNFELVLSYFDSVLHIYQFTRKRMKLFIFTLVALIPALAVAQTTCTDNAAFRFNHDDHTDELMGCDWLTENNAEDRKAKYCVRGPIKGACQASCDFCPC